MPLNEIAKNKAFKGLTCPYTGKSITVRVIAAGRDMPMYFSPDAFDPAEVQPTVAKLLEKAGTRNGIMGALVDGRELMCPYLGTRMAIAAMPDKSGYFLTGGFSPSRPQRGVNEFVKRMLTRGGVSPDTEADAEVAFVEPKDKVAEYDSSKSPDFALEYAEKIIKPLIHKAASVTVGRKITKKRGA